MGKISEILTEYRSLYDEWIVLDHGLMENMPPAKWGELLMETTKRKQEIYRRNNDIILELKHLFDQVKDASDFDELYEKAAELYYEDDFDAAFLLQIFLHLVPEYEKRQDVEKMVFLYSAIQYELIAIHNAQYRNEKVDYSYNAKIRAFMDRFLEFNVKIQRRIVTAYFYYIVTGPDECNISVKDAFRGFDELSVYLNLPGYLEAIEADEEMNARFMDIKSGILLTITKYHQLDSQTRVYLYDYSKNYLESYRKNRKSDYELSPEEYACYLFVRSCENKETPESMFDKFYAYFQHMFLKIQNTDEDDVDPVKRVFAANNSVFLLGIFAKQIQDKKRISNMLNSFLDFVKARWMRGQQELLPYVNELLCKVCSLFFSFDSEDINKEKCIVELIIQRDMNTYIHSKVTSEIARNIYVEMTKTNPAYFEDLPGEIKHILGRFVYFAALFHDIGKTDILGRSVTTRRDLSPHEIVQLEEHTQFGAQVLLDIPEMVPYIDIVNGHHRHYDGKGGYPESYSPEKSRIRQVVDLIAVAVYLVENTNQFSRFDGVNTQFSDVLNKMSMHKGTWFSPEIVECIENSSQLQSKLKYLCVEGRIEVMYEAYHNWLEIQLSDDDNFLLEEIKEKMNSLGVRVKTKEFEHYLVELKRLCEKSKNEFIRGQALYCLNHYYHMVGDWIASKEIEEETFKLLEKTQNYDLLHKNLINQAFVDYISDNLQGALAKNLKALRISDQMPELYYDRIKCLISIANIYFGLENYEKAKIYLEQAYEIAINDSEDELNISCGLGICHIFLKNMDEVQRYRDRVYDFIDQGVRIPGYIMSIYLAWFELSLGNEEQFELYYNNIIKDTFNMTTITYFIVEISLHIKLFKKLDAYDDLAMCLDHFIDMGNRDENPLRIFPMILEERIYCGIKSGDMESVKRYTENLIRVEERIRFSEGKLINYMEQESLRTNEEENKREQVLIANKALEEEIKEAMKQNKQKDVFVSSMSHEIRTPINAIMGMNEMILRECKDNQIIQYASDIKNASKHLMSIINDVLDLTKMESGDIKLEHKQYDLTKMIFEIRNMIGPKILEKKLKFNFNGNEEVPAHLIGDMGRIQQILMNLLTNAYKYTNEGSITVSIDYDKIDEKSILLHFSIKDTGVGMTQEQINRLELPFERFDNVNNRGIEGTGLGLTIVSKLLHHMNSQLKVESRLDEGSCFSFSISQEVSNWKGIGNIEDSIKKPEKAATVAFFKAPKAEILIVDDNAVNLKVAKGLLRRMGAQVTTAGGGLECLELCKEKYYHVILMDHMMPDLDGVITTQKIRQEDELNKETAIIALTANVMDQAEDFYLDNGFNALLTKPVNINDLEKTIKTFLPSYLIEEA